MTFSFTREDINLDNWLAPPFHRFSVHNVCEFVPCAVLRGSGAGRTARAGDAVLQKILVERETGERLPVLRHFKETDTDSVIVLKDGELIAEWHDAHVDPDKPHLLFSVTKSLTGILAGILVEEGVLKENEIAASHIPGLAGSACGTATVRHMLDMTVDLQYSETMDGSPSDFTRYRRAVLWGPQDGLPEGTMVDVTASLRPGPSGHGKKFRYITPVTDMLGLILETTSGRRYSDLLAEKLLDPLGATGYATVALDGQGRARATGGVSLAAYDLALIGQALLDGGRSRDGRQVIPPRWIHDMRHNGDRQAWLDGDCPEIFPDGNYRSCWYNVAGPEAEFLAIGIFGQFLVVDPHRRVVMVRLSSRPTASDPMLTRSEAAILRQAIAAL